MHPQRWGDPAARRRPPRLRARPGRAGLRARRDPGRSTPWPCRRSALSGRAARRRCAASSAPSTCSPTTRPGGCAPAASRPPTCSAPAPATCPTPPTPSSARARTTTSPPCSPGRVEHHVAVVPFGGGTCVTGGLAARRDGFAGLVSLDLVRMKRLLARRPRVHDRRPRAGAARPRGRGAARRGGPDARPLPAVLRVRHDRRLRGHPVLAASPAPATAASTRWSSASGSPRRAASCGSAPPRRTPPAPTCASCSSAPRAPSA